MAESWGRWWLLGAAEERALSPEPGSPLGAGSEAYLISGSLMLNK